MRESSEQNDTDPVQAAGAALGAGNYLAAVEILKNALAHAPGVGLYYAMLGFALNELKQFPAAIANYLEALRIDGPNADTFYNLGNSYVSNGEHALAVVQYELALQLVPHDAECLNNLGLSRFVLRDFALARHAYERALAITPDDVEILNNLASTLHELAEYSQEISILGEIRRHRPEDVSVLARLADCYACYADSLAEARQFDAAVENYHAAIAINPDHLRALNGLGAVFRLIGREDEALPIFERLRDLCPLDPATHINYAASLRDFGRFDEARESYRTALTLRPDSADVMYAMAGMHLLLGEMGQGWAAYEYRWQTVGKGADRHQQTWPRWQLAHAKADSVVLVHAEQGFGDTIQFCRYIQHLLPHVGKVIFEVQSELKSLMQLSLPNCEMIGFGEPISQHVDFQIPLLSLPHALWPLMQHIPAGDRYIHADHAKVAYWKERLSGLSRPKIGLMWSGNPIQPNDFHRSMTLETLAPLMALDCDFVSLQAFPREVDLPALRSMPILDVSNELRSFADTAALVENLDLVISVCTSVAHLAGSLGKPLWVMLTQMPDWRWMLERNDSPWYSSATLYRQVQRGDWRPVVDKVAEDLRDKSFRHACIGDCLG